MDKGLYVCNPQLIQSGNEIEMGFGKSGNNESRLIFITTTRGIVAMAEFGQDESLLVSSRQ